MNARVAVVQEDGRCTFDVREMAGDALSICGAVMFGERFALVVVPDDPAPRSCRFERRRGLARRSATIMAAATDVVHEAGAATGRHDDPPLACADATRFDQGPSCAVGGTRRFDDGVVCPWAREPPEATITLMPAHSCFADPTLTEAAAAAEGPETTWCS